MVNTVPIYEYKAAEEGCDKCRNVFQVRQGMKDEPLTTCPSCGAKVEKMFSSFGVSSSLLAPSNLTQHGFTTLKRRDKGVYEKIS